VCHFNDETVRPLGIFASIFSFTFATHLLYSFLPPSPNPTARQSLGPLRFHLLRCYSGRQVSHKSTQYFHTHPASLLSYLFISHLFSSYLPNAPFLPFLPPSLLSIHPAEIRAMTIFPGTTRIAVGYMGNEECTEIRVWDAVGQGRISRGGTEGGKVVEVPPLWSVPGHDDTIVCLGVIGGEGLVSSGYDRTVRLRK